MINVTSRSRTGSIDLTLSEAKAFMRVDGTADDTLITTLIEQARDLIEAFCSITITAANITVRASARKQFFIPYGPVNSITSVKDTDGNDLTYTWNKLYLLYGSTSYDPTTPESTDTLVDSDVVYAAGYTTTPPGLKLGWMEVVAYLYENRGDNTTINQMLWQNANIMAYRTKVWV